MDNGSKTCTRCGDPNDQAHPWCGSCRQADRLTKLGRADEAERARRHRSDAQLLTLVAGQRWPGRFHPAEVVDA